MLFHFRGCVWFLCMVLVGSLAAAPDQNRRKAAEPPCAAWQARLDHLSDADRGLLTNYGVILRGTWTVSPALVDDCGQRVAIEDYLRAAVAGDVGPPQRESARRYREQLSRVLKKVWTELGHSSAVRADGAFNQEKWGILKYAGLPPADLVDLLRQSLASEGVSAGFVDFVLAQPVRNIEVDLEQIIQREENPSARRDTTSTTEIYCLALLHSMGRKGIAEHLAELKENVRTTAIERQVISTVLARIRAKKRIRWQDVEDLEMQA